MTDAADAKSFVTFRILLVLNIICQAVMKKKLRYYSIKISKLSFIGIS